MRSALRHALDPSFAGARGDPVVAPQRYIRPYGVLREELEPVVVVGLFGKHSVVFSAPVPHDALAGLDLDLADVYIGGRRRIGAVEQVPKRPVPVGRKRCIVPDPLERLDHHVRPVQSAVVDESLGIDGVCFLPDPLDLGFVADEHR